MKVKDIAWAIEEFAPKALAEQYDNVGLIVGDFNAQVSNVLLALDCTQEVLDEAIARGCNMVVAHHPIVFTGLKKITGATYVERVIIKAIKNDIAIYACHTNIDNVMAGVNGKILEKIGATPLSVLRHKPGLLRKLTTFAPKNDALKVLQALFDAGAGQIGNYTHCSFSHHGQGSFMPNDKAKPVIGRQNEQEWVEETKLEVVYEAYKEQVILKALKSEHPYEEAAYDIYTVNNSSTSHGAGLVGHLPEAIKTLDFLQLLAQAFKVPVMKHTAVVKDKIKIVAVCGGSGSFLLQDAIAANADIFITADFKYHEFFDADNKIVIVDIGHFETEQYTSEIFSEILRNKFTNFAPLIAKTITNPVCYFQSSANPNK